MASADYRLCDVCDRKTFYDANLGYEGDGSLDWLGDWAVICEDCHKAYKCVVVPIDMNDDRFNPKKRGGS